MNRYALTSFWLLWTLVSFAQSGDIPDMAEPQMTCGEDAIRFDGYVYGTVLLGEQCWLAQDLRSTRFANGDVIPSGLDTLAWKSAGQARMGASAVYGEGDARCYSGYDKKACDEERSLNQWGRLYNAYAVDDHRGLCPTGWRVPSDADWMELEAHLGIAEEELEANGRRGDKQGFALKQRSRVREGEPTVWRFGAMESGMRDGAGAYWHAGERSFHWSSTRMEAGSGMWADRDGRWMRSILGGAAARGRIERDVQPAEHGFSVRCVTWGRTPHPVRIPEPLRRHPDDTVRIGGWAGESAPNPGPPVSDPDAPCDDPHALNFQLEPPLGPLGCVYDYAQWTGMPPAPITGPDVQRVDHAHYALGYNEAHEAASWTAYELTPEEARSGEHDRTGFKADPRLKTASLETDAFVGTGFDRGHLAPARDMAFDATAMQESFFMSNMAAQVPALNRGKWRSLEGKVHDWAADGRTLWVYTGALFMDAPEIVGQGVHVPSHFYKLVVHPANAVEAIAFIVPNARLESSLSAYHCSIDELENWTGMDFLPCHSEALESVTNVEKWPGLK